MDLKKRLSNLLCVKSIVTIALTVILLVLLLGHYEPPDELLTLYCTSYGAVLTYYFTRSDDNGKR